MHKNTNLFSLLRIRSVELLPRSSLSGHSWKNFSLWNIRTLEHHYLFRYSVAVIVPLFIFSLKIFLRSVYHIEYPFLFSSSAIIISAAYGGFGPGILTTIISFFFIDTFFLPKHYMLAQSTPGQNVILLLYFLEGVFISLLSYLVHITLRKADKQRLQLVRSQEYFRLIVETVQDYAIYTTNSEGYITSWNEGAKRLKGYETDEILGRHFSISYTQEEIEKRKPWSDLKVAEEKGRFEEERIKIKKNGSTFFAHVVITAVRDEKGKLYGFSHISRDMTKHKELDQRKDEFISIASHELKTPLTSIKILNDLLQRLAEKNKYKEGLPYYGKMAQQINKLTDLINTLLDVSKIQAGKLTYKHELFDINDVVKDIVENFQIVSSNHVILLIGKAYGKVKGDKDRVEQVVTNFLTNAIKYSPVDSKITVRILEKKHEVTVTIEDSGIGIAKADQEKVFNRFYRAGEETHKYPGLGIGLYISAEIIKQHKGKIGLKSEKGKGATFFFTLPYH